MITDLLKNYKIILGSASPRRAELLRGLGIDFEIVANGNVNEEYPECEDPIEIPVILSERKANSFGRELQSNEILITADTLVFCKGEILGKPIDRNDAIEMLRKLSNSYHYVVTGVTIKGKQNSTRFKSITKVHFKELNNREIEYYIDNYSPYDKAGAYGVQEWIGYIAITGIEGSYYNVMGLPIQMVSDKLSEFIRSLA